ncbi:MAG: stealth conserved region 3 domain-containing protein [Alphaproteobacteria bacterium]|nr:stealth conserved region 3 domain-containing protein [Alphaproteobacteria bacterium]
MMVTAPGSGEAIDVVYTWVDGNGATGRRAGPLSWFFRGDAQPARFRDNGELRYSLRSLELFAPWVRKVHLVTNGQVPAWLNVDHPKLRLVCHRKIFASARHLPSFNSHAIEAQLHRIPGLAEHFLYFNDDLFLGREVAVSDFLTLGGGQRIYLETWQMPHSRWRGTVADRALAHTQRLLKKRFNLRLPLQAVAHVPQLYRRSLIAKVEVLWPHAFRRTAARKFRGARDVALRVLYFHWMLHEAGEKHEAVLLDDKANTSYVFVGMAPDSKLFHPRLADVAAFRPKFFCINDELGDAGAPEARQAVAEMTAFLDRYFPQPSSFERQ